MRLTTEQLFTFELLKGKTPAQAAYELLSQGRYLTPADTDELEEILLKDFFVSIRYMRAVKRGYWPKLTEYIVKNSINPNQLLTEAIAESRTDFVDALMFIRSYVLTPTTTTQTDKRRHGKYSQ